MSGLLPFNGRSKEMNSDMNTPTLGSGSGEDLHSQFMMLFLKHESDLKAFIRSMVRDHHLANDVFQEVALVLWKEFARFDATRSFGAWARGIASNKILQAWQKAGKAPVALSPEALQSIVEHYDETEDVSMEKESLRHCLNQLPSKARTLIKLRYEESLPVQQIAEKAKQSFHAVEKALGRIRNALQRCIQTRSKLTMELFE
jgi:RNA polymerase sigma-70 factor, ECF subfamily